MLQLKSNICNNTGHTFFSFFIFQVTEQVSNTINTVNGNGSHINVKYNMNEAGH